MGDLQLCGTLNVALSQTGFLSFYLQNCFVNSNLAFPLNYESQIIAYNVLVPHSINRIPCFFSLYRGQFNKGGSCKLQLPHVWFKQKFSTAKFNKGGSCKLQFSQVKYKVFQLSPSSNRAEKREREREEFQKPVFEKNIEKNWLSVFFGFFRIILT